jgi:hypothetical protein
MLRKFKLVTAIQVLSGQEMRQMYFCNKALFGLLLVYQASWRGAAGRACFALEVRTQLERDGTLYCYYVTVVIAILI